MKQCLKIASLSVLLLANQASAFTIINQTNYATDLTIIEACCSISKHDPNALGDPEPLSEPYTITVPAKSQIEITLTRECPVLIVRATTGMCEQVFDSSSHLVKRRIEESKIIESFYRPYSYNYDCSPYITNEWGLVIHEPIAIKLFDFSRARGDKQFDAQRGYGIKCLHPILIKITTVTNLPEELKK